MVPEGAQLDEAAATRPGGMGTRTHLVPLKQKRHYSFNVPIQPDLGQKETIFEVAYHYAYNGRHTLTVRPVSAADHFVVYTARGIDFAAKDDSRFKAVHEDARVETHVALNSHPGEEITFTISGEGKMPPDSSAAEMHFGTSNLIAASAVDMRAPIGPSNSLADSKGWLLLGVTTLSIGICLVILHRRKQAAIVGVEQAQDAFNLSQSSELATVPDAPSPCPRKNSGVLLDTVKEELFALERDKVSGQLSPEEYARIRDGLEAVLRRALDIERR